MNTRKVLQGIKGLSEAKVEKMVEAARKIVTRAGWQCAAQVRLACCT